MRLFANVGFTPEMVTPSIQRRPDLDEIVLFGGGDDRAAVARDQVATVAKSLGIKVRLVDLPDVFEPSRIFNAYLSEFRRLKAPRDVLFNTAGGTGVVVATATAFCIATGIPSVLVNRETGKEIEYPSAMFGFRYGWLESHRLVLQSIVSGGGQVKEVASSTGLTQGRVSMLVKDLVESGFVEAERRGRDKLLSVSPFAKLLLEADALVAQSNGARESGALKTRSAAGRGPNRRS